MCWKVFEMYKPIKILSLYDNAKKSVCDLAFSILSVLILQVYNPQSQCAFVWVSPYLWVCSCIYMYANDSAFISFLNLLWSWWNNSAPTSESAQWACNEWIRSWTLNAKQIIALAAEPHRMNELREADWENNRDMEAQNQRQEDFLFCLENIALHIHKVNDPPVLLMSRVIAVTLWVITLIQSWTKG